MKTARKYTANDRSMSRESRGKAYGAMNIMWKRMRPDLLDEDADTIRAERLKWITNFLRLPRPLDSTTQLTDKQIGSVLDAMRNMTGAKSSPVAAPSSGNVVNLAQYKKQNSASEEQKYTLGKIITHLGWTDEGTRDFLVKRKFGETIEKLAFKKANSLTMILLNIAADKELRAQGKTKITRKMTADYIPTLKKKLEIDHFNHRQRRLERLSF